MKRYQFNKLVRSKLPARMTDEGMVINGCALADEEYVMQLKRKLMEEAEEVSLSTTRENLVVELADVMEVMHALTKAASIDLSEVEAARLEKRDANGDFHADHYINYVEVALDNQKVINYLDNKNRSYKLEEN
jgi:predicted house-cleaning noncanonical NTP pyrophosphatase (MazG superfamily)